MNGLLTTAWKISLSAWERRQKTRVGPPNKHLLCTRHAFVWVTHSWWVYRQADCNNPALLTWILHGDARWLCGRMGEALWMISSGPWVHYDQSRSANLAKCLSAVCRTPQTCLPLREKARGDVENKPPPVPARGIKTNSDKMLDVQQPPFLICGADTDEKVASGRSRPLEGFH